VHRVSVWVVSVVAALAAATFLFFWAHHFFAPVPLRQFEESRLLHQVITLRSYAERESLAGFLPPTDAVIALVRAKLAPDGLTRETERSS